MNLRITSCVRLYSSSFSYNQSQRRQRSYRIAVDDGFGGYRIGEKFVVDEQVPRDADDAEKCQRQEELNVNANAVLTVQLAKTNRNTDLITAGTRLRGSRDKRSYCRHYPPLGLQPP